MYTQFETLVHNLNLSQYQANKLKIHLDRYNIARLEKRGGVLFAPYLSNGLWAWISKVLFGVQADLIGPNKLLLRAQRKIKFCANGYHCVKVGRYVYYANALGQIVSREEFLRNKNN
ncbi:MAG: hypothetical protein IKW57_02885 [Alphaproteobacteria bacterium]|nr:hypothetical protein [Alphaproteobacteria bacterium]